MYFPDPFVPSPEHRGGRMMAAGRVKVTTHDLVSGDHITVLFKCFADNRDRVYSPKVNKNWVSCPLVDCTHLFCEVPSQGEWNDKIGTFYPKTGRWYDADNADPTRVEAAKACAWWLQDPTAWDSTTQNFSEASECGVCGKELTDPESIARGIGPVCLGRLTRSHHQEKNQQQGKDQMEMQVGETNGLQQPTSVSDLYARDPQSPLTSAVMRLTECLHVLPEEDRGVALGLAAAKVIEAYPEAGELFLASLLATAEVKKLTGVVVVPEDPMDFLSR